MKEKLKMYLPIIVMLVLAERFPYHIAADDRKQDEGYPVVDVRDKAFKLIAEQKAERRHERLKSAEINADREHMLRADLFDRKSLANYGLLTCLCKGNYFPSESVAQG